MSPLVRGTTDDIQQIEPQGIVCDESLEKGKQGLHTNVVAGNSEPTPAEKTGKKPSFYLALTSLMLVILIVSLDATALSVAIPIITSDLNGTSLTAFWASISFMLAVVIVQPIYTSVSDVLGRNIALYTGFILFTIGSTIFAVSHSMPILIFGRVIQGLGGGGLDVLNEIIIADITTLKERPLYLGLMSVPMAVGSAIGPILGAVFSEYVTWRWIGWINLPIIGISAPLAVFFLHLKPIEKSIMSRLESLDWIGLVLFAIGITIFALPLSWGGAMYPWSSWRTIVPLVIGIAILAVFVTYEARPTQPVFPYRIFRSHTAQVTLIGSFIHGMVLYTMLFYMPLYFESVFLAAPLQSAVSMLPLLITVTAFSGLAAWVVEYVRHYRWEIWLGWLMLTVGTGLLAIWNAQSSLALKASFQAIAGIGIGALFTVLPIPMQASAPTTEDQGLAVGLLVSFRLFGALVGLAIGSTAFSSTFGQGIASLGFSLPETMAVLNNPSEAIGFIPSLRHMHDLSTEELYAVRNVYRDSMQIIWYILTGFGGLGFLTSLLTASLTLETEELGRQYFDVDIA
ncbi:efflux pump antibiotic resistance protein, putative [Talaromyces stipitatus ATCC 10500]|uniref:Efflux pump antibiotic resistance protein, putative n=1 Tax=Talaromyces stipitatus (strain ATCC 10500 / CBS 375.48 / QM 6759 / NRRL 1006) TaxID=441959 RepID=B8MG45_TALSN|nr:efflux pump antibiotic resistance protein, putative [Talaromyces stipitatus ATCC 10500]EED15912.1 efflux pump antibiotic resistance protein, putative [Talaromyces stipitatus ATCC 10500]